MPQEPPATADGRRAQETPRRMDRSGLSYAWQLAANGAPLHMRQAKRADFNTIEQMFDNAKERLRKLGTDQWSTDWSDEVGHGRMDRVRCSIKEGTAWLAEFRSDDTANPGMLTVATVTIEKTGSSKVWTAAELAAFPSVYLSRLVIAEEVGGFHIGSAIIDWAGRWARNKYGAQRVRIDVWTANFALHNYYRDRKFYESGVVPDDEYPARQRFERPTSIEANLGPEVLTSS
jgi:hypothetical protein